MVDENKSNDFTRVLERLTKLEAKYDAHMEITREIKVMVQMQNGRVRELEKKQSWIWGGLSAVTFVFGSLIAWMKGGN